MFCYYSNFYFYCLIEKTEITITIFIELLFVILSFLFVLGALGWVSYRKPVGQTRWRNLQDPPRWCFSIEASTALLCAGKLLNFDCRICWEHRRCLVSRSLRMSRPEHTHWDTDFVTCVFPLDGKKCAWTWEPLLSTLGRVFRSCASWGGTQVKHCMVFGNVAVWTLEPAGTPTMAAVPQREVVPKPRQAVRS